MAFAECNKLRRFQLNEGIRELGYLCLWKTGLSRLKLPTQTQATPERLGLGQKYAKVLCLPQGLETVGKEWFRGSDIKKLVVPSSVRELGESAFVLCDRLREVVFEPGSQLERIEDSCFCGCDFRRVIVPRSVRLIGTCAFKDCGKLSSLEFEDDSRLDSVGAYALAGTQLTPTNVRLPSTVKDNEYVFGQ